MEIYQVMKLAVKVFNEEDTNNQVTLKDLSRKKRGVESIVIVRSTAMHYAIKHLGYDHNDVARIFNRHRSTVLSNIKTIEGFLDVDKRYQALYKKLTDEIEKVSVEFYITD